MSPSVPQGPATARELRVRLQRKFLERNEQLWRHLPDNVRDSNAARRYGVWLHGLVSGCADREMYLGTQFLRNRPTLELMRRRVDRDTGDGPIRITVLGCSIGAEVYSIIWTLRSSRPELELVVKALDISPEVLRLAESGTYSPEASQMVQASIFNGLTASEREAMFDWEGEQGTIKPWLREGVDWQLGDAADPELVSRLGKQDVVVASNFLCHMPPEMARPCLRNFAQLVAPGGYLFVSGVDLDVRSEVARELDWEPVAELRTEIHDGDSMVRSDWPLRWWGLEPLDRGRPDWETRYTAVFRVRP